MLEQALRDSTAGAHAGTAVLFRNREKRRDSSRAGNDDIVPVHVNQRKFCEDIEVLSLGISMESSEECTHK